MFKIKTIKELKKQFSQCRELKDESINLLKIINNYTDDELIIFEDLNEVLFNKVTWYYQDRPDWRVFDLAETLQKDNEDIDIDSILKDVIDYVALFWNKYGSMLTNYHFKICVWWIKTIIDRNKN